MVELAAGQYNEAVETCMDSAVAMNESSIDWTHAARVCNTFMYIHTYIYPVVLTSKAPPMHTYPCKVYTRVKCAVHVRVQNNVQQSEKI